MGNHFAAGLYVHDIHPWRLKNRLNERGEQKWCCNIAVVTDLEVQLPSIR